MAEISGINVDTAELIQDGSLIMDKAGDYKATATSLFGTISNLMSNWKGDAATKYGDAFSSKQPKVKELGDVVESIGLALNQGGASFQATEQELANMMAGLNGK